MFGCYAGDSLGSFNEFETKLQSEDFMKECMTMPGGGPFMVDAGQFTDDSELSLCLMHGLINGTTSDQNQTTLDLNSIAEYYGKWIKSDPFDIGNTTKSALTILKQKPLAKKAIRMA